MVPPVWRLCLTLLLTGSLCALSGCFGVSQNPSYFPHLWPTGDIIPTHAKPPGLGYFANFDPHAVRLEVRPLEATNPVRTQLVLIATVYDDTGKPRRDRRVEWMLEGVGNIIEVNESGIWPGRGYKLDNKYGVSYTDYTEHRLTRGNVNPNDDLVIRPGQTWCVISSAVEGDTYVTAYAPGIANWDKGRVVAACRWVDASWTFPPPASGPSGSQQVFTTRVFRHTDRQPLANYRVRYRIEDGPLAVFLHSRTQEAVAVSDLSGNATVTLVQAAPALGTNRISIEVIRPPDPTAPSGVGIVIARGETHMDWLAPAVSLTLNGPQTAGLGQEVPYTLTVTNSGKIEARSMTVTDSIPESFVYVRSQPPAIVDGRQLTWTFGRLPPGQAHIVQAVFKATRVGPVTDVASVVTEEGLKDQREVTTQITAPALKVSMTGPATGVVGVPIDYQVTVTNPGNGALTNVVLNATYDPALEAVQNAKTLTLALGKLEPGESKNIPLTLTPRQPGRLATRVTATADGGLSDSAEQTVLVQKAQLTLSVFGPRKRHVGGTAEWDLRVTNAGDVPLTNVIVRDRLPAELRYQSATQGGQPGTGDVLWRLGTLAPHEQRILQLTTVADKLAAAAAQVAEATADPGLRTQAEASLEIVGIPALRMEVVDEGDPVEVGKTVTYRIEITNTGSLPARKVEIKAVIPAELRLVAGKATGPSLATVTGANIAFAPVDVEPQKTVRYMIECQGVTPGDVRFRAEMTSAALDRPCSEEESTTIFDPNARAGAVPAIPPPAGPALTCPLCRATFTSAVTPWAIRYSSSLSERPCGGTFPTCRFLGFVNFPARWKRAATGFSIPQAIVSYSVLGMLTLAKTAAAASDG